MKISLKNFGVLKKAEFSLGDLTIISGKNNIMDKKNTSPNRAQDTSVYQT